MMMVPGSKIDSLISLCGSTMTPCRSTCGECQGSRRHDQVGDCVRFRRDSASCQACRLRSTPVALRDRYLKHSSGR